jgi:hypothetical protein
MGEDCGLRPAWPNSKTPSQLGMMVHVCNLRFRDAVNGLQSKASPRQKCETTWLKYSALSTHTHTKGGVGLGRKA